MVEKNIIGLIPAAVYGTHLHPSANSKELLQIGSQIIEISLKIVEYLKKQINSNGSINDSIDASLTPDDHYCYTFSALAQFLSGSADNNTINSLEYFLTHKNESGSNRGHREFNDLALALIKKIGLNTGLLQKIEDSLQQSDIFYAREKTNRMPVNWMAMRAVYYLLRGKQNTYKKSIRFINKIRLSDDFLYDLPTIIWLKRAETPLTYFIKIVAMLCMANQQLSDKNLFNKIKSSLDIFLEFISPDFESLYFGRTNNGLFGYACAAYSFYKAASFLPKNDPHRKKYLNAGAAMVSWIERWQRQDGHIAIAPNNYEKEKMGWDSYMHNTVYNAYAAVMLMLIGETEEGMPEYSKKKYYYAKRSGLLKINENNFFCVLAIAGQKAHMPGMYGQARYKGMNIYKLMIDGVDICTPPEIDDPEQFNDISIEMGGSQYDGAPVYYNPKVEMAAGIYLIGAAGRLKRRGSGKTTIGSLAGEIYKVKNKIFLTIEKMLPRWAIPYVDWAVYSVKELAAEYRIRKLPQFKKMVIIFTREKTVVTVLTGKFRQLVKNVSFQASPPIGEFYNGPAPVISIQTFSTEKTINSIIDRTLKTSKGPAIQKYGKVEFGKEVFPLTIFSIMCFGVKENVPHIEKNNNFLYSVIFKSEKKSYQLKFNGKVVSIVKSTF